MLLVPVIFFTDANDYYTEGLPLTATGNLNVCLNRFTDLWGPGQHPAVAAHRSGLYEEEIFANHSLSVIRNHDAADAAHPLFLVHAFHLVHTPLQVPDAWLANFSSVDNTMRRKVLAMAEYMDTVVGRLVAALQANANMWDNTLVVWFSDNGGAIYNPAGGNNWPLRGGKYSDYEGGIRGVAAVGGGAVPASRRGSSLNTTVFSVADWFTTLATIAGLAPANASADPAAAAAGLPPVDGIDMSAALLSPTFREQTNSSRELHVSANALIQGRYKLVTGRQVMTGWQGPSYPNNTGPQPGFIPKGWPHDAGAGELYDIFADETEHDNLAATLPGVLARMQARLAELNVGNFAPGRGTPDIGACVQAIKNGGFYGPWVNVTGEAGAEAEAEPEAEAAANAEAGTAPHWPPEWNLTKSTTIQPSSPHGFFEPAHEWGLISLDWSVARDVWMRNGRNRTDCEAVSVEGCRRLKAAGKATRCFIYHNMELALEWEESQRAVMYDPARRDLFLLASSTGLPYAENIDFGDQFFWNYTNPAAGATFVSSVVASLNDSAVDGTFTDDVGGVPQEHPKVAANTGMGPAEMTALQVATGRAHGDLVKALIEAGKFNWQAFNGNQVGDGSGPTVTRANCLAFMRDYCRPARQQEAMMMSMTDNVNQSVAAFLVVRPPIAFLGWGWESGDEKWDDVFLLQVGQPKDGAVCQEGPAGTFSRAWTEGTAVLDCTSWEAALPFRSL